MTQSWATKELLENVLFILQGEMGHLFPLRRCSPFSGRTPVLVFSIEEPAIADLNAISLIIEILIHRYIFSA